MTITDDQRLDHQRGSGRIIGHVAAALSLLCCLSFWILLALPFTWHTFLGSLTGFQWLKIMGASVVLGVIATLLRSKLWRVALPVSLVMFFFTMYVMGS